VLSDNGASYVAGDLARWLDGKGIAQVRGAPNHPQTQGKIERWHQTMKNRVLLETYFLSGQLDAAVRRCHESLGNLTPADAYFGCGQAILEAREKIKKPTIRNRRLSHHGQAA
jgi:putative transposase